MKNRIAGWTLFQSPAALRTQGTAWTRHASTSTPPTGPKKRLGRLAVVTVAAAGIGAYMRWQQDSGSSTTLNPISFTKYTLVSREPVSSTGSIFTLRPARPDGNAEVYEEAWRAGVWSVMFKQPQLQIGRDYTPLPGVIDADANKEEDEGELRFFIRKDPFGEVSRYLHGLGLGSVVEMRGPKIERRIPGQTRDVLFIAGGTGIAPALQAGHTLLRRSDASHRPRIHILWANRRREDCAGGLNDHQEKTQGGWSWFGLRKNSPSSSASPAVQNDIASQSRMVRELEALKSQYPGQVTVDYFVDEERTFIQKQHILGFTDSTEASGSSRNKMILVSGPEGFISYMAGPKLWAQGMEVQGPLQGIIGELGLTGWTTWKL